MFRVIVHLEDTFCTQYLTHWPISWHIASVFLDNVLPPLCHDARLMPSVPPPKEYCIFTGCLAWYAHFTLKHVYLLDIKPIILLSSMKAGHSHAVERGTFRHLWRSTSLVPDVLVEALRRVFVCVCITTLLVTCNNATQQNFILCDIWQQHHLHCIAAGFNYGCLVIYSLLSNPNTFSLIQIVCWKTIEDFVLGDWNLCWPTSLCTKV